jgi:hypothetical protein
MEFMVMFPNCGYGNSITRRCTVELVPRGVLGGSTP